MTSLPITSNAPQPANTANVAYGDSTAGTQAADVQAVEPFASLLARQISEADSPESGTSQVAAILDTTDPAKLKGTPDQAAIATGAITDPTNALAAMLLQIPQEIRTPVSNGAPANAADLKNSMGIDGATRKMASLAYASLDTANSAADKTGASSLAPDKINAPADTTDKTGAFPLAPGKINALADTPDKTGAAASLAPGRINAPADTTDKTGAFPLAPGKINAPADTPDKTGAASLAPGKISVLADTPDKQVITEEASQNTFKSTGLPSNPTLHVQDTAPAINPSAISPMMPNIFAGNKITDSLQTIATPFNSSAWADDFSQKISWMSTQQSQVAELHLNPPDLGPLNVILKISDSQATALFMSPHSAVRDAVENAIPKLREILADNGIMLGNATVSDQPSRDRHANEHINQGSGASAQHEASVDTPKLTALPDARIMPARRHNGMVDTFA
ncbi:MAG: flagellar hook-length control protein FliK [Gallionellaceae bacterium]|jgi:flagellar hook-length control protein FliK|nr:flagellar hook-length control protein FliK [Gallionellaceae bacterium]